MQSFKLVNKANELYDYSFTYILNKMPNKAKTFRISLETELYELIHNIYRANINYDFNVIIEIKKSKVIKGLNFKQKIALFFIKYHSLYVVKPFIYLINKVKYI